MKIKSVQRTAVETPRATLLTILTIVIGLVDIFIEFSPALGLPDKIVAWVSLIGGAVTFIINTILNNRQ